MGVRIRDGGGEGERTRGENVTMQGMKTIYSRYILGNEVKGGGGMNEWMYQNMENEIYERVMQ